MRKITHLIVHYSDTPDHMDIGRKEINRWHVERGWSGVGYHYIIRRDGTIETGRPIEQVGAHARGHNMASVGICWVGRSTPTQAQEKSLYGLLNYLRGQFNLSVDAVVGHGELMATHCPKLNMDRLRAELIFIQPLPKVRS
jgi:N-acetylmuramoyl-L-alanine amidase